MPRPKGHVHTGVYVPTEIHRAFKVACLKLDISPKRVWLDAIRETIERSEQVALQAAFAFNNFKCGPHLALWSLADHLTGKDKVVAVVFHPGLCLAQQKDAAVYARVHSRAVTMARVEHQGDILVKDLYYLQWHP